jgi:hypothetical protein
MEIQAKWKEFALDQFLSEYDAENPEELYDALVEANGDDSLVTEAFERHGVIVWEPFDRYPPSAIACDILNIAEAAQSTAES